MDTASDMIVTITVETDAYICTENTARLEELSKTGVCVHSKLESAPKHYDYNCHGGCKRSPLEQNLFSKYTRRKSKGLRSRLLAPLACRQPPTVGVDAWQRFRASTWGRLHDGPC